MTRKLLIGLLTAITLAVPAQARTLTADNKQALVSVLLGEAKDVHEHLGSERDRYLRFTGVGTVSPIYAEDRSSVIWWCMNHKRRATHIRVRDGYHCCDPALGGIMIPCECVREDLPHGG